MRTYSLAEVAAIALPEDMKNPERWLRERLNSGVLKGYRAGRTWRMREDHLEFLTESRSGSAEQSQPVVEPSEPVSILAGMSERARARIMRGQGDSRRPA